LACAVMRPGAFKLGQRDRAAAPLVPQRDEPPRLPRAHGQRRRPRAAGLPAQPC
jgi:hypothetical protein